MKETGHHVSALYFYITSLIYVSVLLTGHCDSTSEVSLSNTFTVSSFRYPWNQVGPYSFRYIRVELPPWFSSLSIALESNVNLDAGHIGKIPDRKLPVICIRDGSPPLPDVSSTALKSLGSGIDVFNGTFRSNDNVDIAEQCYPFMKNVTLNLTNEQITPGVWYLGLFNGIGPITTQGKMIIRSHSYSFTANISIEGCVGGTAWGAFCNQTIDILPCSQSDNQTGHIMSRGDSSQLSCLTSNETKVYLLNVAVVAEQLLITIDFKNGSNSESTSMYLVRHGALPSLASHDYSAGSNKGPLVIDKPKVGSWYIAIVPANLSKETRILNGNACYTIESQVLQCPVGRAGPNCAWKSYELQTVIKTRSSAFESYYLPFNITTTLADAGGFPLESLLSNFSTFDGEANCSWTYFHTSIPRGAAGRHIHIRLKSDAKINYQVYSRFGGLPSPKSWDYYYANRTSSSVESTFFKLYNSSEEKADFYILYAREGTWSLGLRQVDDSVTSTKSQTVMSISLERCAKGCSSHGQCHDELDASGLAVYSYCSCDRTHGGFDCSIEMVSHKGHMWQSLALILSNVAALFPAYFCLRQKAYAEWVLFTFSGISSGLYHACDVGTVCVLRYSILQFMDFWLSFMAVVSTFVYLSNADEAFKRTIQMVVAILTALMALNNATSSSNVVIVIAIGTAGLLLAWVVELSTKYRSFCISHVFTVDIFNRRHNIKGRLKNVIKTLLKQFRWGYIVIGCLGLGLAWTSWDVVTSETYWIWHSIWHVTIYTTSLFFLCSKVVTANNDPEPVAANYELARLDSPRTTA